MYIIFSVFGIVLILAAVITPLNIFIGGFAGALLVATGLVAKKREDGDLY